MTFLGKLFPKPSRSVSRTNRRPLRLEALEDRLACSVTRVSSTSAVLSRPNSAVVQVQFTKLTLTGFKSYSGSGVLIAPNWVLTAAHNLYGSGGLGWATKVVVHPGQTGMKDGNTEVPYRPFGEANKVNQYVPLQWMAGDQNYDIGLIELDRNVGSTKFAGRLDYGWLDAKWLSQNKPTIGMLGYPADDGYKGNYLYSSTAKVQGVYSLNTNPFDDHNKKRTVPGDQVIRLPKSPDAGKAGKDDLAGASGASGGPVFVGPMTFPGNPHWGNARSVIGVYVRGSTDMAKDPWTEATRITPALFDWINGLVKPTIVNNRYTFPDKAGIDKPDLMPYDTWFNKHLRSGYTLQGSKVTVKLDVWNGGTKESAATKVQFFVSKDPINLTGKVALGNPATLAAMGALNRGSPATATLTQAALPSNAVRGSTYYVGWQIDPQDTVKEYTNNWKGTDNNVGYFQWLMPLFYDGRSWSVVGGARKVASAPAQGTGGTVSRMAGVAIAASNPSGAAARMAAQTTTQRSALVEVEPMETSGYVAKPTLSFAADFLASRRAATATLDDVFASFATQTESAFEVI